MERSKSAPPEGVDLEGEGAINPFYSRKLKDEMKLGYARPVSLPVAAESPEDRQPIQSEGAIGKGRGVSSGSTMAARSSGGSFVTPPSRRTTQKALAAANLELGKQHQCGGRTEGCMPDESEEKKHGDVNVFGNDRHVDHGSGSQVQKPVDELQRSLERELVDHLRDQNAKLLAELEELRQLKQQSSVGHSQVSVSSWSEVQGDGSNAGRVLSKVDDAKQGYHTPRSSNCKAGTGKQDTRYTPNGTRVPDGTPPSTGEPCPPPQHEPPVVPPFPPSVAHDGDDHMKKFLDGYEKVEVTSKVLKRDVSWEPQKEFTPNEARTFWLEKEVAALRNSLAKND